MKYALFLGCTAPVRARNYELSTRKVAEKLGIELVDVDDFACCGFTLESVDHETALLLAARNLSVAKSQGLDICVLCSACAGTLTQANHSLEQDEGLKSQVNAKLRSLGRSYDGGVRVRHFARILFEDLGVEKLNGEITRPLTGVKIATHYGCHYLRPSEIYPGFENPEFPRSLDELVSATGATTVEYSEKKTCCGAGVLAVDEAIPEALASMKIKNAKAAGADAICVLCPFCNIVYESYSLSGGHGLPVVYFTQLLGLALGIPAEDLGTDLNRVDPSPLLDKIQE